VDRKKSGGSTRVNNIFVDHISPIISGDNRNNWNDIINRMFVEEEGLQVLCKDCHDAKTKDEREKRNKK
jgi:hypothetical protein